MQLAGSGCRVTVSIGPARTFVWGLPASLRASVEFLTAGDATARIEDRSTESAAENLRTVVDDLAHAGFDAVAVDLTTEDVDSVGYKVVRVVVPGLQPLDNDHTCMHLGGARLHGELNPDPHPFP